MKITLIGGSGFVGTRLIDLLSQSTFELSNIDKRQSHFFPEITVIGDVENLEDLKGNLKGTDVVVLLFSPLPVSCPEPIAIIALFCW